MMRIKKILATLTLSMACFSGTTQDISKLRIDPSKAYGGTVSEYFSSIEYIPLETNKESLFGDISNMIITDSTFVILDQDTHSVLFFDSTGKYLTKISRSAGYIPAEIFYNKDDNQIIIASYNESRNVKGLLYTTRGEFIADLEASESLAKKISAIYLEGYQANLNNYNQLRNTENDSPFYFYSIYKNGAHHKSLIPYDPKKNEALLKLGSSLPFHPASQTEDPKSFYFSTPLENIVYQVTKDTAIKLFQFILPASYQINNSLLKINKKEQLDSIIQSRSWFKDNTVLAITNISIRDGRVFFQTITGGQNLYDANGTIINRNFIYELKNGKLSSFEHLTPDKSSCFLPFWHLKPAGNLNIISSRGYLYSSLPSLIMFAEKDRNKFRNPQYPVVLQRYFKDQDRKSNPVIVKIKPK